MSKHTANSFQSVNSFSLSLLASRGLYFWFQNYFWLVAWCGAHAYAWRSDTISSAHIMWPKLLWEGVDQFELMAVWSERSCVCWGNGEVWWGLSQCLIYTAGVWWVFCVCVLFVRVVPLHHNSANFKPSTFYSNLSSTKLQNTKGPLSTMCTHRCALNPRLSHVRACMCECLNTCSTESIKRHFLHNPLLRLKDLFSYSEGLFAFPPSHLHTYCIYPSWGCTNYFQQMNPNLKLEVCSIRKL